MRYDLDFAEQIATKKERPNLKRARRSFQLFGLAAMGIVLPGHLEHGWHAFLHGSLWTDEGRELLVIGGATLIAAAKDICELGEKAKHSAVKWYCRQVARGRERLADRLIASTASLLVHAGAFATVC